MHELERADRIGGRIYTRALAIALGGVALVVLISGAVIVRRGDAAFGGAWLAGGLVFGLLARRLWRSRSTLREVFDGEGG